MSATAEEEAVRRVLHTYTLAVDSCDLDALGRVEEVAELAFFLGTPLSSYVTGVVVAIDGGWSAQGITS